MTPQTAVRLLGPEEDDAGSASAIADGQLGVSADPALPAAVGPNGTAARAAAAAVAAAEAIGGADTDMMCYLAKKWVLHMSERVSCNRTRLEGGSTCDCRETQMLAVALCSLLRTFVKQTRFNVDQ